MGQSRPRYVYFRCFQIFTEIVDFSRIRTQIVGVEGERADHLTVTTALREYSVTPGSMPSDKNQRKRHRTGLQKWLKLKKEKTVNTKKTLHD